MTRSSSSQQPGASRRGRRRASDRAAVVRAALDIARAQGVGAVTLRAVASRVGINASNVYTYVETKEALLRAMLDEVFLAALPLPPPDDPRTPAEQLKDIFRALRRRGAAHVELLSLLGLTPATGVAPHLILDRIMSLLSRMGLDPAAQGHVYALLYQVTVANALLTGNRRRAVERGQVIPGPLQTPVEEPDLYPYLARAAAAAMPPLDLDDVFELTLSRVLDVLCPALARSDRTS